MAVGLDNGTMWKITCDGDCHNRLYLFADTAQRAAERAVAEYGWASDGEKTYCRTHKQEVRPTARKHHREAWSPDQ